MKIINIFQAFRYLAIVLVITTFYACSPDKFDQSLPAAPTSDQVKIIATPSTENPNIVNFKFETQGVITAVWDLGNGAVATGKTASGSYAVKGDYTVKLTVFTKGGYASNTLKVTIAQTNVSMLNREDYNFLTGGASNLNGKTWRIEGETKGHMGVGPITAATPEWWSAGPNEKASEGLYDDRMTFNLNGFEYMYNNNGSTFANWASVPLLGGTTSGQNDATVSYTPPTGMVWSIVEEGGKKYLNLSKKGFLGYFTNASRYEILTLKENELYVKGDDGANAGNGWWLRLVPENYHRPVEQKPIKSADIYDDFDTPGNVVWKKEALTLNESYDNPAPVPINTSAKVALYIKQEGQAYEFANMYADFDYKFDLTNRNVFKLKVFVPSYNDFIKAEGESWANPHLLKQVSVKLQDGTSSQPWVNQAEVIQAVTTLDKWVELTFDFSAFKSRKDLDRIVIQIGGEGNFIPGVFFLDDFRLEK